MTLTTPIWLILLPAVLILGYFHKPLRLFTPLRLLLLILLTLLLTEPKLSRQGKSMDLYVLLDRSESTQGLIDNNLPEWKKLLQNSRPDRHHEIHFIDYAAEVSPQDNAERAQYSGSRKLTRSTLAIQNALAYVDPTHSSRVLLFTDGFATEPLGDLADQLQAQGVPLDYRLVREEAIDDFQISRFHTPIRAQPGEPFLLSLTIRGHADATIPLTIFRDDKKLTSTEATLKDGVAQVEFSDRLTTPGAHKYRAVISPEKDAHPGNNSAEHYIEITGGPRLLLITKYTADPLAASLRQQGFDLETVTEPATLSPDQLSGVRAVIFNNVAAHEVPTDFQDALPFYVREQGRGLLMVGGENSFGSGGYFQSPLDPLLPVSLELKEDQRKLAVAMAIVMDNSGSMGAGVAGAGGKLTKMDLANNGAAAAIELLGAMDEICVFAVDSEPEVVIPLTSLKQNKQKAMDRVRRIKVGGGGIYVFVGLERAWQELRLSKQGTKHLILFSDASDSEEPGNYQQLIKEMTDKGVTISVIGLGTKADPDAALLEDIAKLGKGRIFFTDKPLDIPKIFAQETVTIARSAFLKDPVATQPTGNWAEISPDPIKWLPEIDGYNLSYARPDATTSLASKDEYTAPLIAHAREGLGRSMAISFPLGGEHSTRVRAWPGYADFTQTLGRWLLGQELPPGLALRHRLEGTRLTLDLLYDPELWGNELSDQPPRIKLIQNDDDKAIEYAWERLAPGHFSFSQDLPEGSTIRGSIQVGPHAIPFGPLLVGSATEWAFDPERLAELRLTSERSGGRELLNLNDAWESPPKKMATSLRLPLLLSILPLFLLDVLFTRTGWKLPSLRLPAKAEKKVKLAKVKKQEAQKQLSPEVETKASEKPPQTQPQETDHQTRSSRFDRAKKGK